MKFPAICSFLLVIFLLYEEFLFACLCYFSPCQSSLSVIIFWLSRTLISPRGSPLLVEWINSPPQGDTEMIFDITRGQQVIHQQGAGRGERGVGSRHPLRRDRLDLGEARPARPEIVAHIDGVGELHAGVLVNIVSDHEEVERAEADLVTSVCGDGEEGGGDVGVAVEPPEEWSGDGLTEGGDRSDDVTRLETTDGDLDVIGQRHNG